MNRADHLRSLGVDYTAGRDVTHEDYDFVSDKLVQAHDIISTALTTYDRPAVLWDGTQASTLVLFLVRTLLDADDSLTEPTALFLDHDQRPAVVLDFVEYWAGEWEFDLTVVRNNDPVLAEARGRGTAVADLTPRNVVEVRERLTFDDPSFSLRVDAPIGRHLLETVPLVRAINQFEFDALLTGDRAPTGDETFFCACHDVEGYPPHDTVRPILPFTERDVWDATWMALVPGSVPEFPTTGVFPKSEQRLDLFGYDYADVPVCLPYYHGYRSLDDVMQSKPPNTSPAWFHTTKEVSRASMG